MRLLKDVEDVLRVSQSSGDQPAQVAGMAVHQIAKGIRIALNGETDQACIRQAAVHDMSPFDASSASVVARGQGCHVIYGSRFVGPRYRTGSGVPVPVMQVGEVRVTVRQRLVAMPV
jgi:hypothetical protein